MQIYQNIYSFDTLKEAVDFFDKRNIPIEDVNIGGAFGGLEPTEDDDPSFIWTNHHSHEKI